MTQAACFSSAEHREHLRTFCWGIEIVCGQRFAQKSADLTAHFVSSLEFLVGWRAFC